MGVLHGGVDLSCSWGRFETSICSDNEIEVKVDKLNGNIPVFLGDFGHDTPSVTNAFIRASELETRRVDMALVVENGKLQKLSVKAKVIAVHHTERHIIYAACTVVDLVSTGRFLHPQ